MAHTINRLRRRNSDLASHAARMRDARDAWRKKALGRARRIDYLTTELRRCRGKPKPALSEKERLKVMGMKPRYTAEEWAEHARIVKRIERLPKRTIY